MCSPVSIPETCNSNGNAIETRRIVCPMCHDNIYKNRFSLLSNSISENIIVNRIQDSQHLSTYIDNAHFDPYTPESYDSHSPNLDLTISSDSSNTPGTDRIRNELDTSNYHSATQHTANTLTDNFNSSNSAKALVENQSRSSVSPVQLKSRLENLKRISDKDGTSVKKDVDNVENICSSTDTISSDQHRNPCILSMCCSIN